jgi:hypothetical protein
MEKRKSLAAAFQHGWLDGSMVLGDGFRLMVLGLTFSPRQHNLQL